MKASRKTKLSTIEHNAETSQEQKFADGDVKSFIVRKRKTASKTMLQPKNMFAIKQSISKNKTYNKDTEAKPRPYPQINIGTHRKTMEYVVKPWGNHMTTLENHGIQSIPRKTIAESFGKYKTTIQKPATLNCVLCVQSGWDSFSNQGSS